MRGVQGGGKSASKRIIDLPRVSPSRPFTFNNNIHFITTQEASKPREPQALDMPQALPLSEEEEQKVQEIFVQVRFQEERSFWEDERCD